MVTKKTQEFSYFMRNAVTPEPSNGIKKRFFLLKTEIHTQNWNMEPLQCYLMGRRYFRNKIGFLEKAILINSNYIISNYPVFWKIIERKIDLNQFGQIWASWVTQGLSGWSWACLGPVEKYWGESETENATAGQDEYEFIFFLTLFCSPNISAPLNRPEKLLYSNSAYGSQFSGEKNGL